MVLQNGCKLYVKISRRARLFLMFIGAIAILRNAKPSDTLPVMCTGRFRAKGRSEKFFPCEDRIQLRFENMVLLHSRNLLLLANRLR
jgi:hypothetical protein